MHSNNNRRIVPVLDSIKSENRTNDTDKLKTITYLTPRIMFHLQHVITSEHLHSHDGRPHRSEVDFQQGVSSMGFDGFEGDASDNLPLEAEEEGERSSFYLFL